MYFLWLCDPATLYSALRSVGPLRLTAKLHVNGFCRIYSLAPMHCGQMEFNKLSVPSSSIAINSTQSIQKKRERDRKRSNKRAHKYMYRHKDRSQRGRLKEKTSERPKI